MTSDVLQSLLNAVKEGTLGVQDAVARLKTWPLEDIDFAKIDHQRALRTGIPEVVYSAGKTDAQVVAIVDRMIQRAGMALATRISAGAATAIQTAHPDAVHNPTARTLRLRRPELDPAADGLLIVCAGTSDLPIAEEARETALFLGHRPTLLCDVGVAGLHRLLAHRATLESARVIMVCAGMEGALPSVVAGLVSAPVVAVPTSVGYGTALGGLTALLAMLNACAPNVAVVNIDNGFGAACLAHSILQVNVQEAVPAGPRFGSG